MKAIVAVDKNWGIGLKGKLLVSIPADMKFYRSTTLGKVVVMGRKTLESFPNGAPLKDRVNIVLTKNTSFQKNGVIVVHSIDELKDELKKYNSDDVYVIGGETIYKQLIDECDTAYVTKIDYAYEADAYFPNLDEKDNWEVAVEGEEETYYDLEYYFMTYKKK